MVNIYGFNLEKDHLHITILGLLPYVSPEKQKRINAFKDWRDALHIFIGDLLIRAIACRYLGVKNSELQFQTNKYGKPYLAGIKDFNFNLSHSGKWVVCAVDHDAVGIDVETFTPIDLNIAPTFCSPKELAYIMGNPEKERICRFYDVWTLKESYIKALGQGLSKEISSFTIEICGNGKARVKEAYGYSPVFMRQYGLDHNHILSVCAFGHVAKQDNKQIIQMIPEWIMESIPNSKHLKFSDIVYFINSMRSLQNARVNYYPQFITKSQVYFFYPLRDKTIEDHAYNISLWQKHCQKPVKIINVNSDEHSIFDEDINDTILKLNSILGNIDNE
jgi:4'-phosphopantetheinyl transferase